MFAEHLVQDRLAEGSGCCGERYEVPQIGGQGMGLGKTNELCAVRLFSSGLPSPLLTPNLLHIISDRGQTPQMLVRGWLMARTRGKEIFFPGFLSTSLS